MTDLSKVRRRAGVVIAAGLAAASFASAADAAVAASAADAATAPWTVSPSADAPTAGDQLNAVSALDATHAFAVGSAGGHGIAESWDGARWSLMPIPNPDLADTLLGVSAVAPADVWAVGLGKSATGFFNGVTTSADGDVWAVGTATTPAVPEGSNRGALIERWNGSAFVRVVAPPTTDARFTTTLTAVAGSGPDDVYAVGTFGHNGIALHWDGAAWSNVALPAVADATVLLNSVTVIGPNDAWFAGGLSGPTIATVTEQSTATSSAVVASPSGSVRGSLAGLAHTGPALFAVGVQINDPTTFLNQTLALTNPAG